MNQIPGLTDAELKQIFSILLRFFSPKTSFYAFGSRVAGEHRKYSDLDLAIDTGKKIPLSQISQLEESFAQSDLVYKVDLSDFQRVDETFQKHIQETGVKLTPI